ncbi:HAAS signaling domain-containing protein [Salinibacterium hongtaonis]|uniref:HAAS signaling domain-containing protein n=1 Tax=Homoserinimonas hongtaonis TaxID=2079791 RepID=UPI000D392665|nr:hypothetical protein [Salinibacterium hongtaonis]AWB89693.1 hypothetical protein C2138_09200 [Salinibacterium hongtaonis]
MADTTLIGERYLARLNTALTGVSTEVRDEILAGVAEQLTGLDDDAVSVVIAELGDPEFIASEARGASGAAGPPARQRAVDSTWFAVLAASLVMVGGIVVPVIGWIAGVALVWMSSRWRPLERWIATLAPVTISAGLLAVGLIARGASRSDEVANPLLPSPYDLGWTGAVLTPFVAGAVGIWLLVLALRRS